MGEQRLLPVTLSLSVPALQRLCPCRSWLGHFDEQRQAMELDEAAHPLAGIAGFHVLPQLDGPVDGSHDDALPEECFLSSQRVGFSFSSNATFFVLLRSPCASSFLYW